MLRNYGKTELEIRETVGGGQVFEAHQNQRKGWRTEDF